MTSRVCDPCLTLNKNSDAAYNCLECEELLCSNCSDHHKSLKVTRNHQLVDINVSVASKFLFTLPDMKCKNHNEQEFQYFCVDDDVVCCRDCLPEKHRTCKNVLSVESASKNVKNSESFRECEIEMSFINDTQSELLKTTQKIEEKVLKDSGKVKEKITNLKRALVDCASLMEKEMLELVEKQENIILEEFRSLQGNVRSILEQDTEKLDEFNFVSKNGTSKQVFLLCHKLSEYIQERKEQLETTCSNMKEYSIEFKENPNLLTSIPPFGEVSTDSRLHHVEFRPPKDDQAQMVKTSDVLKVSETSNLKFICNFHVKGSSITNIAITDDDTIAFTQYNVFGSSKLWFYTLSGQILGTVNIMTEPVDVAYVPETNLVAVSISRRYENCLQFCSVKTMTIVKKIVFADPIEGIDISPNNILLSCEEKLVLTDIDGNPLQSVLVPETKIKFAKFGKNGDIFYKTERKIGMVRNGSAPITIYESDDISRDSNFAVHKNGEIYITKKGSSRLIKLIVQNDKIIRSDILEPTCLRRPCFLCFNKTSTKLVVADGIDQIGIYSCSLVKALD